MPDGAWLGLASTREMFEELRARGDVAATVKADLPFSAYLREISDLMLRVLPDETLDYRTVDDL